MIFAARCPRRLAQRSPRRRAFSAVSFCHWKCCAGTPRGPCARRPMICALTGRPRPPPRPRRRVDSRTACWSRSSRCPSSSRASSRRRSRCSKSRASSRRRRSRCSQRSSSFCSGRFCRAVTGSYRIERRRQRWSVAIILATSVRGVPATQVNAERRARPPERARRRRLWKQIGQFDSSKMLGFEHWPATQM